MLEVWGCSINEERTMQLNILGQATSLDTGKSAIRQIYFSSQADFRQQNGVAG